MRSIFACLCVTVVFFVFVSTGLIGMTVKLLEFLQWKLADLRDFMVAHAEAFE